jgi:hypothetical protein
MPDAQWVGLADAIRALRSELTTAMTEGADQALRFELGPVEMEFLLEVQKEAGGEAGVRFWVISLGGKGSVSSGSTHRVTLALTPRTREGGTPKISDWEKPRTSQDRAGSLAHMGDVEPGQGRKQSADDQ